MSSFEAPGIQRAGNKKRSPDFPGACLGPVGITNGVSAAGCFGEPARESAPDAWLGRDSKNTRAELG